MIWYRCAVIAILVEILQAQYQCNEVMRDGVFLWLPILVALLRFAVWCFQKHEQSKPNGKSN